MNPWARRSLLAAPLALFAIGGTSFYLLLQNLGSGDYDPRRVPSVLVGKEVPEFSLGEQPGLAGFGRAELTAPGRPVLVNFFASWCLPCVAEAPQLLALAKRGVAIYGVAYKDKADKTAEFLARHGNPFTRLGRDAEGKAGMEFGLYGVPETYFIDGRGIVRARWAGALTDETIARSLNPLLKQYA